MAEEEFDFDGVYDRTATESAKWHTYPPGVLPMHVADMDFHSPPAVVRALEERARHGFFGYGREEPAFFELVAERLFRRYRWEVPPEAIVILPGVIASFNVAARALAAPGDRIAVHVPGYPPLLHCAESYGCSRLDLPLGVDASGRYLLASEGLAARLAGVPLLLLCNPHNPTGRVFRRAELEALAAACLESGTVVCSDEIHCDLLAPGEAHVPIASLSKEVEARTITLMAPSKTFNLPGLKASIAVIPDAGLRERFNAGRGMLVRGVNILGYTAMAAAYRDGDAWLAALTEYLAANCRYLSEFVAAELPGVAFTPPEGTYLAWLDCRALPVPGGDAQAFFLERAKVGLSNGAPFGPGGEGFLRLNFACPRSMLEEALERMRQAVRELD